MPHYIQAVSIKFSGMDLDLNPFFNTDTPDLSLVQNFPKINLFICSLDAPYCFSSFGAVVSAEIGFSKELSSDFESCFTILGFSPPIPGLGYVASPANQHIPLWK